MEPRGKDQIKKAKQKKQERRQISISSYERFGKFLLKQIGSDIDIDAFDWDEVIKSYSKRTKAFNHKAVPGLMYMNWVVATRLGMDPVAVRDVKTRKREYIKTKHTVIYLAVVLFKYEYAPLQEFYSLKNHATIINAVDRIRDLIFSDKQFKGIINELTDKFLGYYEQDQRRDTIRSLASISKAIIPEGNSMSIDGNREVESSD